MNTLLIIELLKSLLIGVVEGITEWLPISSTGHMILVDEFVQLEVSPTFLKLFLVVIQIGAIMAVIILFFNKLNPFARTKTPDEKRGTWRLWGMVVIGCIPAAIVGFALDDWVSDHFYSAYTVAAMLIMYGIIFIVLERRNHKKRAECVARLRSEDANVNATRSSLSGTSNNVARLQVADASADVSANANAGVRLGVIGADVCAKKPRGKHAGVDKTLRMSSRARSVDDDAIDARVEAPAITEDRINEQMFDVVHVEDIDWKCALKIGFFQCLAIIPGTSRSGAIIIGSMLMKCSRVAATEFAFFLAIPVMLGWGIVKVVKYLVLGSLQMTSLEVMVLVVGVLSAFIVSILSIKFLIGYIKKHDFEVFGWYRIIVGLIVLAYFLAKMFIA